VHDIARWIEDAPQRIRDALADVSVLNSLRERRNHAFQMIGTYDGAESETCKRLWRRDFEALDEMIKALERK